MDGPNDELTLAPPYHERKSGTALWFGRRYRDGQMDGRRRMDAGQKMLLSHTLTMRGSHVERSVKLRPVV